MQYFCSISTTGSRLYVGRTLILHAISESTVVGDEGNKDGNRKPNALYVADIQTT
jgi:hypothetical protein